MVRKHRQAHRTRCQIDQHGDESGTRTEHQGDPAHQQRLQAERQDAVHVDGDGPESPEEQRAQKGLKSPVDAQSAQVSRQHQRSPPSLRHS